MGGGETRGTIYGGPAQGRTGEGERRGDFRDFIIFTK